MFFVIHAANMLNINSRDFNMKSYLDFNGPQIFNRKSEWPIQK